MISILIYCHKEREAKELCQLCRYCIALLGDDHLLPHMYYDELDSLRGRAVLQMGTGSMLEQREKRGLPDLVKSIGMSPDMILFEIRGQADLLQLEKIRRCFPDALLAILADSQYLRTGICIRHFVPLCCCSGRLSQRRRWRVCDSYLVIIMNKEMGWRIRTGWSSVEGKRSGIFVTGELCIWRHAIEDFPSL